MKLEPVENFSENGARPGQFLGSSLPIDRLGALVFRPLDRHGNAIVGGGHAVPLTRIAGRDASIAGAPRKSEKRSPRKILCRFEAGATAHRL